MNKTILISILVLGLAGRLTQIEASRIDGDQNHGLFLPFNTEVNLAQNFESPFYNILAAERFPEGDDLSLLMKILERTIFNEYRMRIKYKYSEHAIIKYLLNLNIMDKMVYPQKYTFDGDDLERYLGNILLQTAIPSSLADLVQTSLKDLMFSNEKNWFGVDLLFLNNEETRSNYAYILGKYNKSLNRTFLLFGYLFEDLNFIISKPVFQIKKFDSEDSQREKVSFDISSSNISEEEIRDSFDLLQITAFKAFLSEISSRSDFLLSKQVLLAETDAKDEKNFTTKWFDAMDFLRFSVGNVTGMWNSITSTFKTEKKSEIKQVLSGRGFSYFAQSGQAQKSFGMKAEFYPKFKESLLRRLQIPENKKQDFLDVLETFENSDEQTWNAYETVFSINSQGECKFVYILANRNETSNKINFIFSDLKATFKLAPDVMVIQQSNSYLGGIFSESKLKFKEIPRGVTEEDLKSIFDFFNVVAFKNVADLLQMKVTLPDLK